jgi:UDP-2,3-diacylglucosamine pyrophosphatase LpxH
MNKNDMYLIGLQKRNGELKESWDELNYMHGNVFASGDTFRTYVRIRQKRENDLLPKETAKTVETEDSPIIDIPNSILRDIKKSAEIDFLLKKYKITERILDATIEDLADRGFQIKKNEGKIFICKDLIPQSNVVEMNWNRDKIIRFGVVSDTHIGSKHQQITHLNNTYDFFAKEGIRDVYHAGDLSEGEGMRKGHAYECFLHGADAIEEYIIKNYPKRDGIVTRFITGNHDHSMIQSCGHDIGIPISKERKDMIYLGKSNATVYITPNCTMELNHPLDGASYAISYSIQKLADSLSGGEKPNILVNGHHHKAMTMFYRNIHMMEAGTFEAQTPWMKGKRIAAHMGGYIITVHVDEEGTITRFCPEFIPYYYSVKNDY